MSDICKAIAVAETSNCTRGTALTHNNCFGIKENGAFVHFSSKARSFRSCEYNWEKHYGGVVPTMKEAIKWTGNDRPITWLKHVKQSLSQ